MTSPDADETVPVSLYRPSPWHPEETFAQPSEPVPVLVLDRGEWFPGALLAWRRRDGAWDGHVHFVVSGVHHVAWRAADLIRRDT